MTSQFVLSLVRNIAKEVLPFASFFFLLHYGAPVAFIANCIHWDYAIITAVFIKWIESISLIYCWNYRTRFIGCIASRVLHRRWALRGTVCTTTDSQRERASHQALHEPVVLVGKVECKQTTPEFKWRRAKSTLSRPSPLFSSSIQVQFQCSLTVSANETTAPNDLAMLFTGPWQEANSNLLH